MMDGTNSPATFHPQPPIVDPPPVTFPSESRDKEGLVGEIGRRERSMIWYNARPASTKILSWGTMLRGVRGCTTQARRWPCPRCRLGQIQVLEVTAGPSSRPDMGRWRSNLLGLSSSRLGRNDIREYRPWCGGELLVGLRWGDGLDVIERVGFG